MSRKEAALFRLAGLIVILIATTVALISLTGLLSGKSDQSSYRTHLAEMEVIGAESSRIGAESAALLSEPGVTRKTIDSRLRSLVRQQEMNVTQAESLDPPGPLDEAHHAAIEALQLRLVGLRGFLATVRATASEKDSTVAAEQLAVQSDRLIASDVLWEDAFAAAALTVLADREVVGATPPASIFVTDVADWSVSRLRRLQETLNGVVAQAPPAAGAKPGEQPAATPGIHGSLLEGVTVDPAGTSLSPQTETTVVASPDMAFRVAVRNSGESPETQVQVTLTIGTEPTPVVKTETIAAIDAGASATVVFDGIPELPIGKSIVIGVRIEPVPGEANTDNNGAEYPVVFSL